MTCTVQPREVGDTRQKSICIYLFAYDEFTHSGQN